MDQIAPGDELADAVHTRTSALLITGPNAISECKQLLDSLSPITEETVNKTAAINARIRVSAEAREGMSAFLEGRKPEWAP